MIESGNPRQSVCQPMIVSSATDFRAVAQRKLPPFLFHYLDGGAGAEQTLRANVDDLQQINLRQRILQGSEDLDLTTGWFGNTYGMPICLLYTSPSPRDLSTSRMPSSA